MNRLSQLCYGLIVVLGLGFNVGCAKGSAGSDVNFQTAEDSSPSEINPEIDPATVSETTKKSARKNKNPHKCKQTSEKCFSETFEQPNQPASAVDVLFVVQTSEVISNEIQTVVSGINTFVNSLPEDTDFNIGVMLSHGSTSALSGRLYQADAEPIVLKASELSNVDLQTYLTAKLTNLVVDPDAGGGEEGMFSLFHAITTPALLAEAQAQDFFRTDAALAVVFIGDRRDICAVVPPGVPAESNPIKIDARIRDCEGLTAAGLTNRLELLKGDLPVAVSGIIYADAPAPAGEEIGYGYTDVIALNAGVAIDIANDNIAEGLEFILELSGDQTQIQNEFVLMHENIDPKKIIVTVNGEGVPFKLIGNKVIITSEIPAGATVVIAYCLKTKPSCNGHHHGHRKCRKHKTYKHHNWYGHGHGHSNHNHYRHH
ncbi:hypothetical protein [Bdellovibrio sp. HCB337]|uniref:hypothetical protein n=1 Tax=Bdellovibrio sp. HCB337 TaxID=3394358 RepID=UPI0039A5FBE9